MAEMVGLLASVVTLVAVINDTCKVCIEIHEFYNKASMLARRLQDDLNISRVLVSAIISELNSQDNEQVSPQLREIWTDASGRMVSDYKELYTELLKLRGHGRVTLFFARDGIARLQKNIARHIGTLQLVKAVVIGNQIERVQNEIQLMSQTITQLPRALAQPQPNQFVKISRPLRSGTRAQAVSSHSKQVNITPFRASIPISARVAQHYKRRVLYCEVFVGTLVMKSKQRPGSQQTDYLITFVPSSWFSKVTLQTTLNIVKTATGQLPIFTWTCRTWTTHVLPRRRAACVSCKNKWFWSGRKLNCTKGHEFCEDELFNLCRRRGTLVSDRVMWPGATLIVEGQPLLEVLYDIFLERQFLAEEEDAVMKLLENQNMNNEHTSTQLIDAGMSSPSYRRAVFSEALLEAGASLPSHLSLATTLTAIQSFAPSEVLVDEDSRYEVFYKSDELAEEDIDEPTGLQYLRAIGRFFDISLFEELDDLNIWILASLIASTPSIRTCMATQAAELGLELDGPQFPWLESTCLVNQILQSLPETRIKFLEFIAIGGDYSMLSPLLTAGVDIDRQSPQYLKGAIEHFNFDTALAILENCPSLGDWNTFSLLCGIYVDMTQINTSDITLQVNTWRTRSIRYITRRGGSFLRLLQFLLKRLNFATLPPNDNVLILAVVFLIGIILPGPIHRIKFWELSDITGSYWYHDWPMHTGVEIAKAFLGAGILNNGRLRVQIRAHNDCEKWFGYYWKGSPITTAGRYLTNSQFEIIKLFVQYGYDLYEEDDMCETAMLSAIMNRRGISSWRTPPKRDTRHLVIYLMESLPDFKQPTAFGIVQWRWVMGFMWGLSVSVEEPWLQYKQQIEKHPSLSSIDLPKLFQDSKDEIDRLPHSHSLPPGWVSGGFFHDKQSKSVWRPIFLSAFHNQNPPFNKGLPIISFQCPCQTCLLSCRNTPDSKQRHAPLPAGWSVLPWPSYPRSDEGETEKSEWFSFEESETFTNIRQQATSAIIAPCPSDPRAEGTCSLFHRTLQIDRAYHQPFAINCYKTPQAYGATKHPFKHDIPPYIFWRSVDDKHVIDCGNLNSYERNMRPWKIIPYYVNLERKERTWDCPCEGCYMSGAYPAIENFEQIREKKMQVEREGAKALNQWPSKHVTRQPQLADIYSAQQDYPELPNGKALAWVFPQSKEDLAALGLYLRDLLAQKVQTYDNDNGYYTRVGAKAADQMELWLVFVTVVCSVVALRLMEGLKVLWWLVHFHYTWVTDGRGTYKFPGAALKTACLALLLSLILVSMSPRG